MASMANEAKSVWHCQQAANKLLAKGSRFGQLHNGDAPPVYPLSYSTVMTC